MRLHYWRAREWRVWLHDFSEVERFELMMARLRMAEKVMYTTSLYWVGDRGG